MDSVYPSLVTSSKQKRKEKMNKQEKIYQAIETFNMIGEPISFKLLKDYIFENYNLEVTHEEVETVLFGSPVSEEKTQEGTTLAIALTESNYGEARTVDGRSTVHYSLEWDMFYYVPDTQATIKDTWILDIDQLDRLVLFGKNLCWVAIN